MTEEGEMDFKLDQTASKEIEGESSIHVYNFTS